MSRPSALLLGLLLLGACLVARCAAQDVHEHSHTVSAGHHDHEDDDHDHDHHEGDDDHSRLVAMKITSIVVIPLASVLVVLFVIFVPWCRVGSRVLSFASSFSAGLFLVMALTHLLPESVETLGGEAYSDKYSPAFISCAAGYLLIVFLERGVFGGHGHQHHHCDNDPQEEDDEPRPADQEPVTAEVAGGATPSSEEGASAPGVVVDVASSPQKSHGGQHALVTVTLVALGVHSIFVGMSLGLQDSAEDVTLLLVAILCHQWAEDFALAVATGKAGYSIPRRLLISALETVSCAVGIGIGWIVQSSVSDIAVAYLVAASAGTCLNLACTAIIPEEMPREKKSWWALAAAFAGAAVMYVVKVLLHSAHAQAHDHEHAH